jgi:hypothetical protein
LKKASAVVDKANRSSDDLNVFGDFVASELRGLRNDSVRKNAKRNIQLILLNAGLEDDNLSTHLNFHSSSRMITALSVSSNQSRPILNCPSADDGFSMSSPV